MKEKEYEFGVMLNKWTLKAEDEFIAKLTMSIFLGKNIPIAIYSPKRSCFMPKDIFEQDNNKTNPEDIKKCFGTIKEMKL